MNTRHDNVQNILQMFENVRPYHYQVIIKYSNHHCPRGSLPTTPPTFYFKLPYIGHISVVTQNLRIRLLIKRFIIAMI